MFGVLLKASAPLSERIERRFGVAAEDFFEEFKKVMEILRKGGVDDSFVFWRPVLDKLKIDLTNEEFFNFWFEDEKLDKELTAYLKEMKKKGIKIFILSRSFKERTEYHKKHNSEVFELIDKSYFSWENGIGKPNPEAWKQILREHNLKPEECGFVDDKSENIEAARSLGIEAEIYEGIATIKKLLENYG